MEKDIAKILITEEEIRRRVAELGEELTRDYAGGKRVRRWLAGALWAAAGAVAVGAAWLLTVLV